MFKDRAGTFRTDFLGGLGSFDFLAEFGYGVLDNAMVGTAGTVIRTGADPNSAGEFIRLHDLDAAAKESAFIRVLTNTHDGVKRRYTVNLSDFSKVPGNTICYSIPDEVRDLHDTLKKLDAEVADLDAESVGFARQGVATATTLDFFATTGK